MALGIVNRGTGGNATSGTSLSFSPTGNLAATSLVDLRVSLDNSHTGGAAQPSITVTDTKGNTWAPRVNVVNNPGGSVNSGVQAVIWTTAQDGGALTTGDTITVSWTTAAAAKSYVILEITGGAAYSSSGSSTASASTTPSITTASLSSGDLAVASLHTELGSSGAYTADTDTTNGSWSSAVRAVVGAGSINGSTTTAQAKTVSGAGTQTFNPTLSNAADLVIAWVSYVSAGVTGSVSSSLSGPTASASAVVAVTGSLSASTPAPTLTASTFVAVTGHVSTSLPAPTLAATVAASVSGSVAASLALPSLSASVQIGVSGTVSSSLQAPQLAASAQVAVSASLSAPLSPPALDASGHVSITGQVSATLAAPTLSAAASVSTSGVVGSLAATLALPVLSTSALVSITGQVSAALSTPSLRATAYIGRPIGDVLCMHDVEFLVASLSFGYARATIDAEDPTAASLSSLLAAATVADATLASAALTSAFMEC